VFKDKLLRKIFRRKKEAVEGDWEDFIRRSLKIMRVIKSRRTR